MKLTRFWMASLMNIKARREAIKTGEAVSAKKMKIF